MRRPTEPTKYTINFTEEDKKQQVINAFKQLIIERDCPNIDKEAKKLAKKYLKSEQK